MDIEVQDLSQKDIFVDMRWSEVLKEDKYVDRVAIIPYSRVPDFIKGEEINLDAPCSFFRRRNIVKDDLDERDFTSNKYSMWVSLFIVIHVLYIVYFVLWVY